MKTTYPSERLSFKDWLAYIKRMSSKANKVKTINLNDK